MAKDLEDWEAGKVKPKPPSSVRPGGNLQKDLPSIPISPGGYMKTKPTQQYEKGGSVAVPILPRNMRPRSTPNAELNAQKREQTVRELTGEPDPPVKDVPLRGYLNGGSVKHGSTTQAGWKGGR
jgi:hypothetical protein